MSGLEAEAESFSVHGIAGFDPKRTLQLHSKLSVRQQREL
jgi:hypothetical protein